MPVQPKRSGRFPVSAKTQAGGLGALSGVGIAAAVIGLVEAYWTHHPLPEATADAIYLACGYAVAMLGSYFAPNQDRAPAEPVSGDLVEQLADPALTGMEHRPVRDEATGQYTARPPGA